MVTGYIHEAFIQLEAKVTGYTLIACGCSTQCCQPCLQGTTSQTNHQDGYLLYTCSNSSFLCLSIPPHVIKGLGKSRSRMC